jgi:uncharacterized membrane protein YbhN (UPF0104 family)
MTLLLRSAGLLAVSALVLTFVVRKAGAREVVANLGAADIKWVLLALLAFGGEILLRIARCVLLFRGLPARFAAASWAIGSGVYEVAPAGTGEMVRAYVGSRWFGASAADVFAPAAIERIFDILVLGALALVAIAVFTSVPLSVVILIGAAAVVAGLLLLRSGVVGRLGMRIPAHGGLLGRAGGFAARVDESFRASARRPLALLCAMGLTLAIWALAAFEQVLVLRSVGVSIGFATMVGITGASVLAGFLTFLPGGLGSREATYAALLSASGAPYGVVASGVVALRVMQSLIMLTIGLGTAAFVFTGRPRPVEPGAVDARSPRTP